MDFPGHVAALEKAFEVAMGLHETYPSAALWAGADLAFVYGISSRHADALQIINRHDFLAHADRLQPQTENSVYAIRHHAQVLFHYGRQEQALAVNSRALAIAGEISVAPTIVRDAHELQVIVLLALGRVDAAKTELAVADQLSHETGDDRWPASLRRVRLHAQLALAQGKPDEARRTFASYDPGPPGSGRQLRRWIVQRLTNAEIALALNDAASAAADSQAVIDRLTREPARRLFALSEAQAHYLLGTAARRPGPQAGAAKAVAALRQSLAMYRQLVDTDSSAMLGRVEIELAQAEMDSHHAELAAPLLAHARALRARHAEMPRDWDEAIHRALVRAKADHRRP